MTSATEEIPDVDDDDPARSDDHRSMDVGGGRRLALLAVLELLVVALGACGGGAGSADGPASSDAPTADSPESPSGTGSGSATPPACPNVEGGACLGPLRPGTSYTTTRFQPAISYEVPGRGWANYEDLFGNFLLVPPGNDLDGVNAGTSDYLGVYRAVLPSQLAGPVCGAEWPLGEESGPSPAAMVRYYRTQKNLVVSNVREVEVSGRSGMVLDIEAARGVPLDHCREGTTRVEVTSVISGVDGAGFDHGVIRGMTMRLYLVPDAGRVIGIEITDIDAAPGSLDSMSRVAEALIFAGSG
jgi:hypothetical protein